MNMNARATLAKGHSRTSCRASVRYRNVVIRQVCDREGNVIGVIGETHDGTPEGIIHGASKATEQMFAQYDCASNIQSRMIASDSNGLPRWSISPNFQHLAEINTDEALYIWSGRRQS